MKALIPLIAAAALTLGTSCTTMYDSYGQPRQVVTPEGAAMAAVAAGVIGYALADDHDKHKNRHRGGHGGGQAYGGGYGGHGGAHPLAYLNGF